MISFKEISNLSYLGCAVCMGILTSWCGQKDGWSGWGMPLMTVPTRPASRASSRFISSTGFIASHLASSTFNSPILELDSAQKAVNAAFCSAAWSSIAVRSSTACWMKMHPIKFYLSKIPDLMDREWWELRTSSGSCQPCQEQSPCCRQRSRWLAEQQEECSRSWDVPQPSPWEQQRHCSAGQGSWKQEQQSQLQKL